MRFDFTTTVSAVATAVLLTLAPATSQAGGDDVTVYFTRHAEKQTTTTVLGPATKTYELAYDENGDGTVTPSAEEGASVGDNLDEVCGTKKCAEELSDLGLLRADLLVEYFDRKGVIDELDAVYSSHKYRTRQTVEPTAAAAGLTVVQLPEGGTELQPEGTTASECPTLEAIRAAAPGSTLLVAGHSGTLYDIMGAGNEDCPDLGLGLDIGDDEAFPKSTKAGKEGDVRDFGDVWQVVIKDGEAKLRERVNLQPVRLRVVSKAR